MADLTLTVGDLLYLLDMVAGKEAIALIKFKDACGTPGEPFDTKAAHYYAGVLEGLTFTRGHVYELFIQRLKDAGNA